LADFFYSKSVVAYYGQNCYIRFSLWWL